MKKLTIILTILAISIISAQCSYAAMDDKSDRLSNEQSGVFSPGYINATMQKTQSIIKQTDKNRSPIEAKSDAVKADLSNKVAEDSADKPKLDLKKKTGGSGEGKAVVEQKNPAGSGDAEPPAGSQVQEGLYRAKQEGSRREDEGYDEGLHRQAIEGA